MDFFGFVRKYTGLLLMVFIVIGYLFPQMAIFKSSLSWLLIIMLFISLLKIDLHLHRFFRPGLLLYGLFNWIVLPTIIMFLSKGLAHEYRIGLLIAIITPTALGSPVIISLLDGDLEFILTQVILYNLLAPLSFAFLPLLYFQGANVEIPVITILLNVGKIILIPLVLSLLVKRNLKAKEFIINKFSKFVPLMVIFLAMVVVASASNQIRATHPKTVMIIFSLTLLASALLYLIGFLLGKGEQKRTLPVALGHKNTGLAIIVCLNSFSPLVALPSIFYIISHHIMNAIILQINSKRK